MVARHSLAETSPESPPDLADALVLGVTQRIVNDPSTERAAARRNHGQRKTDRPCPIDVSVPQGLTIRVGGRLEAGDPAADLRGVHRYSIARDDGRRPAAPAGREREIRRLDFEVLSEGAGRIPLSPACMFILGVKHHLEGRWRGLRGQWVSEEYLV